MNQHFTDAKDLINNDELSNSFAKHFASHFQDKKHTSRGDVRNITNVEIVWQGNPMSSIKTFRNLNCNPCTKERLEIYKAMQLDQKNNSKLFINSLNELYGGCRHSPKFHGYCNICPESADEAIAAEKLKNGQIQKSLFFTVAFWKNNY